MPDSKAKNAYRYFIYNIHEYLKLEYCNLENRRLDSFRALLSDFIDLYIEINSDGTDKTKFQKSLNNLMETVVFYCEENPISKHPKLCNDIKSLKELLQSEKPDPSAIYNTINSLYKKMNRLNVLELCIDIMQNQVKDFFEVDKLTETYISELIFEGYSLKYLEEWWGKTFKSEVMKDLSTEEELKRILDRFRELSNRKNEIYEVILKVSLPRQLKEELEQKGTIQISNIVYKNLELGNFECHAEFEKFFESNKYQNIVVEIRSCDIYKSIELSKTPLENYVEMYRVIDTSIKNKIVNGCLIKEQGVWREITLHNDVGVKGLTIREREDVEDFITLRDVLRISNVKSFDIDVIERVINLQQKMSELSRENRLLNTWTSLEYILKFYNKESIIEKVRQVVPRVICLYFIKSKMNSLWDKLLPYADRLENLQECISAENKKKYNRDSFVAFLKDKDKATKLYEYFDTHILIQRKIAELNGMLNKPEDLIKIITYTFNSVKHDLNSIYRLRNKLVHSGGNIKIDIELYSNKLQKYVNSIVGTIIYHINRSPESTISEVLYSIIQTYDDYTDIIKKLTVENDPNKVSGFIEENLKRIAYPPYLYL